MSEATHTIIRPNSDRVPEQTNQRHSAAPRRVYMMDLTRSRRAPPDPIITWIVEAGFDTLLLSLPRHLGTDDIGTLPAIADKAAAAGLHVQLDLALHRATDAAPSTRQHPDWYEAKARKIADPREPPAPSGMHTLSLRTPAATEAFTDYWAAGLRQFAEHGIDGFRCRPSDAVSPVTWRALIASSPDFHFSVWTPGMPETEVRRLPGGCFHLAYNSLAWWDFGAEWFREEAARLSAIAPVASSVGLPNGPISSRTPPMARRALNVAASTGNGLLVPMGFEFGMSSDLTCPEFGADDWGRLRDHAWLDLTLAIREANRRLPAHVPGTVSPLFLSSPDAPVAVLFESPAQLTIANRHLNQTVTFDPSAVLPMLDGRLAMSLDADPVSLAPGEVRVFTGEPVAQVVTAAPRRKRDAAGTRRIANAAATSRVAIEAIEPSVDLGRFAAKRVVGERVTVAADIFIDGHGKLAAALQWRAKDQTEWREMPMRVVNNDRWSASFMLERVGPYVFRIVAWPDRFSTWRDEVGKKFAAGLDVTLELEEGRLLIEAMAKAAPGTLDTLVDAIRPRKTQKAPISDRIALLTGDETAAAVARADARPGQTTSVEMPVDADRRAAEFASWYELFPRNQSGDPSRHGTFRDVIHRLPAIRDMGFDVLYFPPIHPIGRTNRKGRDNTMTPAPDDPGSPYAIGATEGGHDAIHPELGTIEDFRALRDAAAEHGLELALDFAVQCSPDHPWLRQHPDWFDWRPDGGLRYAENPPKKYEDIVNVDFHRPGAIPGLWAALRDVVAYWAGEGVRIFRVDNPHTKPFSFWEWLIADIRATYPDALFLAEAFTRPKIMYRLAKLGFSQSYTYFTWRNEKWEIEEYLRELTTDAVDFFRPNFFVNTPDINPIFLQTSGRPGFLIRAALATTLSGLWGMLQGFEFCEAEPVPGREEYASSDKYQLRARLERSPGDIVEEITRLNAIRRANPALQSHRGLAFHQASNERVIWFRKANVDRSNVVLVAVNLDPFTTQTASVEVPLWEWGLADDAALLVTDLMHGGDATWQGKYRSITLDPRTLPFGIWRARPVETN